MDRVAAAAILLALITLGSLAAVYAQEGGWVYVDTGVGFYTKYPCDYGVGHCWFAFSFPFYVREILVYDDMVWFTDFWVPDYLYKPISFGVAVWNGNASVELVTNNVIRVVVDAPTGTKSTLVLYGVQPKRILVNGQDIGMPPAGTLEQLGSMPLGWLHDGYALYLRATHHSQVVWEVWLSQPPTETTPTTKTPILVVGAEETTTTPYHEYVVTVTLPSGREVELPTWLVIALLIGAAAALFAAARRRLTA